MTTHYKMVEQKKFPSHQVLVTDKADHIQQRLKSKGN